jgi:hypothetical protein
VVNVGEATLEEVAGALQNQPETLADVGLGMRIAASKQHAGHLGHLGLAAVSDLAGEEAEDDGGWKTGPRDLVSNQGHEIPIGSCRR